jgi:mono/diheme cytochrome c family protein
LKGTLPGTPPTDQDLLRTVTRGVPGTGMPAFDRPLLRVEERYAVVAQVKALAAAGWPEAAPVEIPIPASSPLSESEAARAKATYLRLGCGACHGASGRGDGPAAASLQSDRAALVGLPDLSRPETFKGGPRASDVFVRITAGMDGTPMPSYREAASDGDRMSLAQFIAEGRFAREPGVAPQLERGRYLAESLACAYCHTPIDRQGRPRVDRTFAGGTPIDLPPFGHYQASNLTSHPTGIGGASDEAVAAAIRRGRGLDGRRLQPLVMPWPYYAHLTDDDVAALVAYLRALVPIDSRVSPPARYGPIDGTLGKLRLLVFGQPVRLQVHPTETP